MCLAYRGVVDMSRISNRASTVAAVLGIVLLVILLVILWTGVYTTNDTQNQEESSPDPAAHRLRRLLDGKTTIVPTTIADISLNNEVFPKGNSVSMETNNSSRPSSTKVDLEYVKLEKISENQYEDPPDNFSTAKRHDSGHFRHSTAQVWDPHPQYEFTAFGRQFRLRLAHDSSFVSPNIKVTHMSENTIRKEHPGHELDCFYSGTVDGDPYSTVSVSLCHGMTGHVKTSTESYIINPVEPWPGNDKDSVGYSLQHAIQRIRTPSVETNRVDDVDDQFGNRNCGVMDDDTPIPIADNASGDKIYVGGRTRKRRSLSQKTSPMHSQGREKYEEFVGQSEHRRNFLQTNDRYKRYYSVESGKNDLSEEYGLNSEMELDPFVTWRPRRALPREYFIEIMVVADAAMVKYHGKSLFNYILVLMGTVSWIYKDQSIGNPITISVMKIVQTDEVFAEKHPKSDGIAAGDLLNKFCEWQTKNNPKELSPEHYDVAVLLTRENLCHNLEKMRCDTLGLAELGRICVPESSCAIVQDTGLAAAFTIAHEIGHVLNMPHDDDKRCINFWNPSGGHNIMSRVLDDSTFPWKWSKCSRHYVTEFLEAGYGNCLLDEPAKTMEREDVSRLPGEDYSANKQCELAFGPGSTLCADMEDDVCRKLWCYVPKRDTDRCHTQNMPLADGTACGVNKWCHRGDCVSRRKLVPIHGQWGEWEAYSECSRTCGGGVKKKTRECNNPPPDNGGKYCIGDHVKYRSCGIKECPPGTPDFREQQCAEFDNKNINIHNLTSDVKWHAKYTEILPQDRCKLYCQMESHQYYKLRNSVIDGTPCGPDTFHICVNGYCEPAGCDHVLNSSAELDTCGVCRGDNSTCQRIRGSYNSTRYGYTKVVKIPAGSSNIDIRQLGWMNSHNDNNYLALRIGDENGRYILNGDYMVMHRKVIVQPDVTIEYSGRKSVVERLNSSRPISTDLVLEILSVCNVYPAQITYEYTVPKRILNSYTWVLSDWSKCSHTCQGTTYRRAECRSTEHKDVVSNDYCREEERPREESQICNNRCTLQWQITSMSECSSHCGPGTRTVTYRCIQILLYTNHPPQPISTEACAHLPRPSDKVPCKGPCKNVHWSYGEWGSCSVTCGGGIQSRRAVCVDSNERPVPEESCAGLEKHLKRICGQNTCPKWDLGEWTPCSVSCGVGKRERDYLCHVKNRIVDNSFCGDLPFGVVEICNAGPCEQWYAGDWNPCSVTCGEGTKRRKVVCKSADGTRSNKCSLSDKPEDVTTCMIKPCPTVANVPRIKYSSDPPHDDLSQQDNEVDITFQSGYKWEAGSYKECSKPCINGFMRTTVKCISVETGIIAPDDYCNTKKKPSFLIACNRHRCPMWNTGNWSQCNAECGTGIQTRLVRCQNPHGEILPDNNCHDSEKPEGVTMCQQKPCVADITNTKNRLETNILRKWKVSSWSPCSKSCGSGVQRRRVECTMRRGNHGPEVTVKDEQCLRLGLNKPRAQRLCRRIACGYIWQESLWSECSAECGDGIQNRTVTCHRTNRYGLIDPTPSNNCPMDQKPATKQSCKLGECDDKYHWTADSWKKCSHTCGQKGRQTRRLFCRDRTGKKVARSKCPPQFKPQRKRKCNQKKCYAMSCLEAKKYFKTTKDGDYTLVIGGRSMLIYCHRMSTSEPKEYLTLPTSTGENYAEVYDKRLNNPNTCPYNGQRNDSCNCITDEKKPGSISGKTMFGRIRIDPVNLHIIENDYTFSITNGRRVEYGTAGDCYSRVQCPQGRFSINLTGTRLRLSPSVTWTGTSRSFMEIQAISSQHITGKCGGDCGFCHPRTGLKLDVLPP